MQTVKELAIQLNVKESWVRQQVFKRKIPFKKLNGLIRFDPAEIEKWLSDQTHLSNRNLKNKDGHI